MQKNKLKSYMPHEYIKGSNNDSSFYKNMFISDIVLGIIPIKLNASEDKVKASISCNDKDLNLIKSILNNFSQYSEMYDIERLIKNAIEGIARNILWYGDSIYEIQKVNKDKIRFVNLIPNKFMDFKLFYIQIPPKNKKETLFPRLISKKILWKISIPDKLQKKYSYKKILSYIDKFDSLMPKTFRNDLNSGHNIYHNYDAKKYREKSFIYINDLTSEWGWNQRSMGNEYTTEFFKNYKYLKFNLSQAIFREHIIYELNNLFKKLELKASLSLDGLPSSKDCEKYIEKYIRNDISYNDIFNI